MRDLGMTGSMRRATMKNRGRGGGRGTKGGGRRGGGGGGGVRIEEDEEDLGMEEEGLMERGDTRFGTKGMVEYGDSD